MSEVFHDDKALRILQAKVLELVDPYPNPDMQRAFEKALLFAKSLTEDQWKALKVVCGLEYLQTLHAKELINKLERLLIRQQVIMKAHQSLNDACAAFSKEFKPVEEEFLKKYENRSLLSSFRSVLKDITDASDRWFFVSRLEEEHWKLFSEACGVEDIPPATRKELIRRLREETEERLRRSQALVKLENAYKEIVQEK